MSEISLRAEERAILERATTQGMERAAVGLSEMIGREIELRTPRATIVPVTGIWSQLPPPDEETMAIYLWLGDALPTHVVLLFAPAKARDLIDLLLERPPGSAGKLEELEVSALGEVGNLMGTFFANVLADLSNRRVRVSTPVVREDILGAIVGDIIADIALTTDDVLVVNAAFAQAERDVKGIFLVLFDTNTLRALLHELAGQA